jgi:cation diffusion facilitator family transporter
LFTGAASLLAEFIHSVADSTDQGLLFWGRRRGRRPATTTHPFGYGRERYFWALVVAIVLFTAGGLFALFEAEEKLRNPHELRSLWWAIAILCAAFVFESASLAVTARRARTLKGEQRWFAFIRASKEAELPVVLLEDTAALVGITFAFLGVVLADLTGNARFDALGSLGIGALLIVVALTLAGEMKSLLIGESAAREVERAARLALESDQRVHRITEMRTEQLGPDRILIGAKFVLADDGDATRVAAALRQMEDAIQVAVPEEAVIFLEPVTGDTPGPIGPRPPA